MMKNRYMENSHKKVIIDDTGFRADNVLVKWVNRSLVAVFSLSDHRKVVIWSGSPSSIYVDPLLEQQYCQIPAKQCN